MVRRIVFIICLCAVAAACGKPKFIPEKKMAAIMSDIFMSNSYANLRLGGVNYDTLDIYTPVLEKYGYRIGDLRYTLDEMSKRKSSRLTYIVDAAISDLNDKTAYLKARERMFLRMDSTITQTFLDTVFFSDTVRRIDAKNLELNDIGLKVTAGDYTVSYNYTVDTVTKGARVVSRYRLFDTLGKSRYNNTFTLARQMERHRASYSLEVGEDMDSLSIQLVDNIARLTDPKVTVDSVYVTHSAPIDSLRPRMRIRLTGFDPARYKNFQNAETEKDSLAQDVQPAPGDSTRSAADVR